MRERLIRSRAATHCHRRSVMSLLVVAAVTLLCACGGDDPAPDERASTPRPKPTATPGKASAQIADGTPAAAARTFRSLYSAGDPRACELLAPSFDSGSEATCEQVVRRQGFDYAIITLLKEGNRVGERSATINASIRRRSGGGDADLTDGEIVMRNGPAGWRIAAIRAQD